MDLYKSEDSRRAVRLLIPHKLFMIVQSVTICPYGAIAVTLFFGNIIRDMRMDSEGILHFSSFFMP